jgi:hypothetical protein
MYGGPIIKHLDDVPAQEMLRFQFADGHTASIWEKWIQMSPHYIAFWNTWDPGAMTPHHGHRGDHVNLILKGDIRDRDGNVYGAGTHIMLEYGDQFGPWEAGPDGVELYGFVAAVGGSGGAAYPGDPDIWAQFLEERGAVSVPLPMPKLLPPWTSGLAAAAGVTNWTDS